MKYFYPPRDVDRIKESLRKETRFSLRLGQISFYTDTGIVKTLIPKPLEPVVPALALAYFSDVYRSNIGISYRESALAVTCRHRDEYGIYFLSIPVTDDMALIMGREVYGIPKKLADAISIDMDESGFEGICTRKGTDVMAGFMEPGRSIDQAELIRILNPNQEPIPETMEMTAFTFKHFLSPAGFGFDYPTRLVRQKTASRLLGKATVGQNIQLDLCSSPVDPFGEIPVEKIAFGYYGEFDAVMHKGAVLAEVDDHEYTPFAFNGLDTLPDFVER